MKLSELIGEPVQTVAYCPRLRAIAGSVNAAVLLSQLLYWTGKQRDPDGWIQKRTSAPDTELDSARDPSIQNLPVETGLTYKELKRARRMLRGKGFLRERRDYAEHVIYFRLDTAAIRAAWFRLYGEPPPKDTPVVTEKDISDVPSVHDVVDQRDMSDVPSVHQVVDRRDISGVPSGNLLNGTSIDYAETTPESSSREGSAAAASGGGRAGSAPEDPEPRIPTTPAQAMGNQAIRLFREVCGRFPGEQQYRSVIETMNYLQEQQGEATLEYLRPFWLAWSSRRRRSDGLPYDGSSLTWLTEWALNGTIPVQTGGKDGQDKTDRRSARREDREPPFTAEQLATIERINGKVRQPRLPDL